MSTRCSYDFSYIFNNFLPNQEFLNRNSPKPTIQCKESEKSNFPFFENADLNLKLFTF